MLDIALGVLFAIAGVELLVLMAFAIVDLWRDLRAGR